MTALSKHTAVYFMLATSAYICANTVREASSQEINVYHKFQRLFCRFLSLKTIFEININVRTLCRIFPVLLMVFCTTYVFIVNGAYINRPIFSIFFSLRLYLHVSSQNYLNLFSFKWRRLSTRDFFLYVTQKKSFNCIFIIMRSIN